jgi:bifunctional enzyme CysN/CysC
VVRKLKLQQGRTVLHFASELAAPIEECMRRDTKGLYAKVQAGQIRNFTGVEAPYETPQQPDIHLKTIGQTPGALADKIIGALQKREITSVRNS